MNTASRRQSMLGITSLAMALLAAASASGQDTDTLRLVTNSVTTFFKSMGSRNVEKLKEVVADTFVVVETGNNPTVHIVESKDSSSLLPPEGNDDWADIHLSNFSIDATNSSRGVASASFTLSKALSDTQLEGIKTVLAGADLPDEHRTYLKQAVESKTSNFTSKAMLARDNASWKIVSISVP